MVVQRLIDEKSWKKYLKEQKTYLKRLKHRAKVRGGPDISAMGIADEAIKRIDELLGELK